MTATVVTFYSFKGGVGRTQALANMALGLACAGKHVIAVDMDLESPGLHFFFPPPADHVGAETGVLEFFEECFAQPDEPPRVIERLQPCAPALLPEGAASIRLLRAGRFTEDYAWRLARFSWEEFYADRGGYRSVEYLRDVLVNAGADYVLVDSRTGATDVGSVCTFQLPDVVLVFFALHEQGIHGAERVIRAITAQRDEPEHRLRRVVAVPSRVDETGEDSLRDQWLDRVRGRLGGLADDVLIEPGRRLPHMSRAAFGEYLVDPTLRDGSYLHAAYANLVRVLLPHGADAVQPQHALRALDACEETLAAMEHAWTEMTSGRVPLDRAAPWAERLAAGAATLTRRTRALTAQIGAVHDLLELPWGASSDAPPTSVMGWRALVDSLQAGMARLRDAAGDVEARARSAFGPGEPPRELLERTARPLRDGDLTAFAEVWPGALAELRRSSPLAAIAERDVSLREFTEWFPRDAPQQWIDLLLQNALAARREASTPTPASDRTLLNLLRLALGVDDRFRAHHWSAYALALEGASPALARELFDEVGATLWPRTWLSVIEPPEAVFGEDYLESPAALEQVERLSQEGDAALMAGAEAIFNALVRTWSQGRADHIRALFRRHAAHPYLLAATALAGPSREGAIGVVAALLDAQRTTGLSPPQRLVERLGELLAEDGRVAEAFYLLCAEGQRVTTIPKSDTFSAVTAAFLLRARSKGRADIIEDTLVQEGVAGTAARVVAGVVWLSWIASGLDLHEWSTAVYPAAGRALESSDLFATQAPEAVRALLAVRGSEAHVVARDALRWDALVRDIDTRVENVSVHKSLGMASKYEAAFRRYWRQKLRPYRDLSQDHRHDPAEFARVDVDDVVRIAKSEHRGLDGLAGSARNSLVGQFDEVRALATELAEVVARVPAQSRAALPRRKAAAAAARAAFEQWVIVAEGAVSSRWRAVDLRHATLEAGP